MTTGFRKLARVCLPASLRRWWRLRFGWQWFRGDYVSWPEARAASGGYDDVAVLARVVAAGAKFAGEALTFHVSLDEAVAAGGAQTILLSSVLPYLEAPVTLLEDIVRRGFKHVIIDRTPFVSRGRTRLAMQHTPPELGGGSYPCWLCNENELLAPLHACYRLVRLWPALDDLAGNVRHRGIHFQRKAQ